MLRTARRGASGAAPSEHAVPVMARAERTRAYPYFASRAVLRGAAVQLGGCRYLPPRRETPAAGVPRRCCELRAAVGTAEHPPLRVVSCGPLSDSGAPASLAMTGFRVSVATLGRAPIGSWSAEAGPPGGTETPRDAGPLPVAGTPACGACQWWTAATPTSRCLVLAGVRFRPRSGTCSTRAMTGAGMRRVRM